MGIGATLRSLPRRIRDSIEQEGLLQAVWRGALSPVYRAGILRARPLDPGSSGRRALPYALTVRTASEDDIDAIVALRPQYDRRTLLTRLQEGQECVVSWDVCTPTSVYWTCKGRGPLVHLGLVLPLEDREVFVHDLYRDPARRHKGEGDVTRRYLDQRYAREGIDSVVSCATAGRGPYGRGDPDRVATIRTLRLGPFRRFWVRTCGPQAEYWRGRLRELRWA